MPGARVYRYRPFLAGAAVCLLVVGAGVGLVVGGVVRHHDYASVVKAILVLVPLLAFAAFLVLVWRVRTVVDDDGITQHWISRGYRMAYAEITGVEIDQASSRWFLRVRCGERTFEVIPCHRIGPWTVGAGARPPRALIAVRAAIEENRAGYADRRGETHGSGDGERGHGRG